MYFNVSSIYLSIFDAKSVANIKIVYNLMLDKNVGIL